MRILLATESYYPNIDGGAVARRSLAMRLKKRGHEVAVIAPGFRPENYHEEIDGIKIYRTSGRVLPLYPDYRFSVFPFFEVKKVLREFRPDIVDINSPYQIGLSTLIWTKKMNIPAVGTIHVQPENMLMSVHRTKFLFNIMENLSWFYIINFFNRCDYVTSPTQTAIDLMRAHGLKAKAQPVSSGIDLNVFNPENDGHRLKEKYSLPDKPTMLYTGRISGEKRLDVLISAMPKILNTMDAHLVICGDGRERENLEKMADKLKVSSNITFTGFISHEEFPNVYALADLFVIPSESELQSIVTLEALASGLPVVAADKHALPELVKNPGNGYLVPAGDSGAFSSNIVKILSDSDLQKSMGAASLEIVKEHSLKNTILKFENLYNNTIDSFKSK